MLHSVYIFGILQLQMKVAPALLDLQSLQRLESSLRWETS